MEYTYLLMHIYEYNHSAGYEEIEEKYLGVYSTEEQAQKAAKRYYKLPGFSKYPFECFYIERCKLDEDMCWLDGFVNVDDE